MNCSRQLGKTLVEHLLRQAVAFVGMFIGGSTPLKVAGFVGAGPKPCGVAIATAEPTPLGGGAAARRGEPAANLILGAGSSLMLTSGSFFLNSKTMFAGAPFLAGASYAALTSK